MPIKLLNSSKFTLPALPDNTTGFVYAETVEHAFAMRPKDQTNLYPLLADFEWPDETRYVVMGPYNRERRQTGQRQQRSRSS